MSKNETMHIAFPNGGSIPASVLKEKDDRKVGPHEAVRVPRSYGEHMVANRFAYEADPAKAKAPATGTKGSADGREEDLKKFASVLASREEALKTAESDLAVRTEALEKLIADVGAREEAVKTAETALADREAAVSKSEADLLAREDAAKQAAKNGNS
ncbi:MAG TPA: hypothetical protein VGV39_15100 [Mesorhizobium sp.]|jgi:hypothetical protein|uniref:hypothetical protein n=1 Tax=Mesorhizobium sp. TaxID=1871066 RepID=UPI002DDDAA8A|nr:hypothetical protein [Mesorhizobium sp.]HEV2504404.1 hypothetical protein [Mesorhizobium sp.]